MTQDPPALGLGITTPARTPYLSPHNFSLLQTQHPCSERYLQCALRAGGTGSFNLVRPWARRVELSLCSGRRRACWVPTPPGSPFTARGPRGTPQPHYCPKAAVRRLFIIGAMADGEGGDYWKEQGQRRGYSFAQCSQPPSGEDDLSVSWSNSSTPLVVPPTPDHLRPTGQGDMTTPDDVPTRVTQVNMCPLCKKEASSPLSASACACDGWLDARRLATRGTPL